MMATRTSRVRLLQLHIAGGRLYRPIEARSSCGREPGAICAFGWTDVFGCCSVSIAGLGCRAELGDRNEAISRGSALVGLAHLRSPGSRRPRLRSRIHYDRGYSCLRQISSRLNPLGASWMRSRFRRNRFLNGRNNFHELRRRPETAITYYGVS